MLTILNRRIVRLTMCVAGGAFLMLSTPAPAQPPEGDESGLEAERFGPQRRGDRDGPRRRRPGGSDRMIWERLNDEERESIRAMVAEHFPDRLEDFETATSGDQSKRGRFMRVVSELMRLRELKERNPEMFEVQAAHMRLDFQLRRLAREYRFTEDDAERQNLRAEIREVAAEKFDMQGVRMEIEIDQLRAKLDHLQSGIEKRFADRDDAIDHMVERITGGGRFDGPPAKGNMRERLRYLRERRGIKDRKESAVPEPKP